MDDDDIETVFITPIMQLLIPEETVQLRGRLLITTESGSRYEIDTDRERLRRIPGNRAPDDPEVGFPSQLRRDGEELVLLRILNLAIGEPAVFDVEPLGDPGRVTFTRRTTTYVIDISQVDEGPSAEKRA